MSPPDDRSTLDEIRASVDAAHAAADRLVREATARAREKATEDSTSGAAWGRAAEAEAAFRAQTSDTPSSGWAAPPPPPGPEGPSDELRAIVALLELARDAMRSSVPAELQRQLGEAVRELLLAVRALIDWYIERIDRPPPRAHGAAVEDIPID